MKLPAPLGRMARLGRGPDLGARLTAEPALRLLLEAGGGALALLDAEGRLAAWNRELAALAGPTLPLRPRMSAAGLVPEVERPALTGLLASPRGEAGGEARGETGDFTLANAGATAISIEALALPPPAGGGQEGRLLRISARAAQGPEAMLAAAERQRAVGALAGGIAHDFNNILGAIACGAEAALAREPSAEVAAELRQILDSAGRGAALVRQILAFARQQALQPRVIALNHAVAEIAGLLRRVLGARVRLELELEEPGRQVRVDPTQLDQVVVNLAVNARDAMPEGGVLRIATREALLLRPEPAGPETIPPGRYMLLEVSDTGRGIPPELLPRIFEPFFTTRREKGGSGLGLSTVLGILRQSGGHVAVESTPGEGTRFRIWLPRHEGPAEPPAPAPAAAAPVPAAPSSGGGLVLLAEDEATLRRLAERALERAGFAVLAAESGEELLERIDSAIDSALNPALGAPAMLVSDMVMPGMDGLALAGALRGRWPGLPVLLVSGYAEAALGRDLGAEGIRLMSKPYALKELVTAVEGAVPTRQRTPWGTQLSV
jgi:two-component system cell cycle sensor histidine kinase/response regulator CckA